MPIKSFNTRYILVKFTGEKPNSVEFNKLLRRKVVLLVGELFLSKSGLHVFNLNSEQDYLVVRVKQDLRSYIMGCLPLVKFNSCYIEIIGVFGTIKSLKRKMQL
jgi:RNase P/RNase MRP subunit POP5